MLGLSQEDLEAMNLQTLRARDPAIEQVLGSAGHVSLYDFDRATASWVRGSTPVTPPLRLWGSVLPRALPAPAPRRPAPLTPVAFAPSEKVCFQFLVPSARARRSAAEPPCCSLHLLN